MKEFRCKFCHRLLAKVGEAESVEIKCPKCKTMNLWSGDGALILQVGQNAAMRRMSSNGRIRPHVSPNFVNQSMM